MAIDTAAKRRAVAGIAAHPFGPAVTPDATPGAEWRQQVAWGYSGIAAGGEAPPDETHWNAVTGISGITGGGDIEF